MKKNYYFFLIIIIGLGLLLQLIPLSGIYKQISPFFYLVFYAIWLLRFSSYFQFLIAVFFGLLIDFTLGDKIGINPLCMVLSSGYLLYFRKSFLKSDFTMQTCYIFLTSFIYLVVKILFYWFINGFNFSIFLLLAPLTTALLWPFIYLFFFINIK